MTDPENIKTRYIRKRDGRVVTFDPDKITDAIFKAAVAVGGKDRQAAGSVTDSVIGILDIIYKDGRIPTVENVQDLVEKMLIERGHAKVAKAFIIYREQHRKLRQTADLINEGLQLIEEYLDQSDWRGEREQQHELFPSGAEQSYRFRYHG